MLSSRRPHARLWRSFARAVLLLAASAALSGADAPLPSGDDFGEGITLAAARSLSEVMAEPERYTDEPILVRARISDVCQRKGCWTILREGESTVRVRFKDYGFFLPKEISGREALVEGVVAIRTMSEREARHFAAETRGGKPEEIDGPQREIGFVATGVRVLPAS
ncbi:MAG: DUF4920 domain-containing protein [Myxococcota bacterium]